MCTGRRMSLAKPRDNIGISCLPTTELETSETDDETREDSTTSGEYEKFPKERGIIGIMTNNPPKKHDQRHQFDDAFKNTCNTSSKLRLRGGKDPRYKSQYPDTNHTNVISKEEKHRKKFFHHNTDALSLLTEESNEENKDEIERNSTHLETIGNKFGIIQPVEISISNVRRAKHVPGKPRKPIMPGDNFRLTCQNLQKGTDRPIAPKVKSSIDIKKTFGNTEKKELQSKSSSTLFRDKQKTDQARTLESISKLTILLLYLHFLLSYYLSFAKTQPFVELFEMCPITEGGK